MPLPFSPSRRPVTVAVLGAVAGLLASAPAVSRGGLTFFTARADFVAAAPGLPVESFGGANLHGQPYVTQANGLSNATNNAVFASGSILPGITLSTLNPGLQSNALEVEGGGSAGHGVGTNWFQDTLVLGFAPGVSSVGEDVFGHVYPGPGFAGQVTEAVYGGSILLGSTHLDEAAGAGGFLGVTSSTANITSVRLFFKPTADVDSNTFVGNIAFGPAPSSVPEPSSLALSAVAATLLGLGAAARRRLRHARRPG